MPKATSPSPEHDAGSKRKADQSAASETSASQEQRPSKQQKTIEESMGKSEHAHGNGTSVSNQESNGSQKHEDGAIGQNDEDGTNGSWKHENPTNGSQEHEDSTNGSQKHEASTDDSQKPENNVNGSQKQDKPANGNDDEDEEPSDPQPHEDDTTQESGQSNAIQESSERSAAQPSNILEKGIIYFFTRGRVSVDQPESVQDLARSYFVLRPLAPGAQITSGPIQDQGHNRLLALPKKVWPKSGQDKFMVFVESAPTDMATLKANFFTGSDYTTQTTGSRHTPEITPLGEGVYALTSTGDGSAATTHLSYLLTIPQELGAVQRDVGIVEKGSFVLSLKNPDRDGPASAALPEKPEFPPAITDQFRGRGWMPATPESLDYPNAQVLLIGEDFESSHNLDSAPKDQSRNEIETPQEELEKLEGEDERRVARLSGDDTVFADLGLSKKEYPAVLTTW